MVKKDTGSGSGIPICGTERHDRIRLSVKTFVHMTAPASVAGVEVAGLGHCTACGELLVAQELATERAFGQASTAVELGDRLGLRPCFAVPVLGQIGIRRLGWRSW